MTEKKPVLRDFIILYAAYVVYSFSAVFSKLAAKQADFKMLVVFMAAEFVLLGIYALIYQQALKKFPLGVAMSNKGITVILALVWSAVIFGEKITVANIAGVLLIVAGIWMVSADD